MDSELASLLGTIRNEIDRSLLRGEAVTADLWIQKHPELAHEITSLVEFRAALHQEGLLSDDDAALSEVRLAEVAALVQDAVNQGKAPDLVAWQARHPDAAPELERLSQVNSFLKEALGPDAVELSSRSGPREEDALGRYRLKEPIARHALGRVFLAHDQDTSHPLEILVLRPEVPRELAWRALREAEHSKVLGGEGFCRVLDVGEVRGVRFIASEHVRGVPLSRAILELAFRGGTRTLGQVIPPHGTPVVEEEDEDDVAEAQADAERAVRRIATDLRHLEASLRVVAKIGRRLVFAHLKGRPHLGLEPEAVVIATDGTPWIRWASLGRIRFEPSSVKAPSRPEFRAPELLLSDAPLDWRADVYGAGALLHSLLFLRAPFESNGTDKVRRSDFDRAQMSLAARLEPFPHDLSALLRGALAPDLSERIVDCGHFASECEALADALTKKPEAVKEAGATEENARPTGFLRGIFSKRKRP